MGWMGSRTLHIMLLHAVAAKLPRCEYLDLPRRCCPPPKPRNKLGIDAILDFAAADFFRKKAPLGQMFALPASVSVAVLGDKLASQFSQSQSARGASQQDSAHVLEADYEELVEQHAAIPGLLCFKVLSTKAGAAKVIAPAPAAGMKLNQDAITATLRICSGGIRTVGRRSLRLNL